jgi:hypothetical protein
LDRPKRDLWSYRDENLFGRSAGQRLEIVGYDVEALDGAIGSIDHATYEPGASYIVVDTGPWIFGKQIMLPAWAIERVDRKRGKVFVDRRKEEIKNAPEFDAKTKQEARYRDRLGEYYDPLYGPGGTTIESVVREPGR